MLDNDDKKFLNVSSLYRQLENLKDKHGEDKIVLSLQSPSMGPVATISFKENIWAGFDWEKGLVILQATQPVVIKTEKEELWDMAADFVYGLSTETYTRNGVTKPSSLARRALEIMELSRKLHKKVNHA